MAIKIKDDIKYSIWVTKHSEGSLGWSKKFKELEIWCKENCIGDFMVAKPTPIERIFIFDEESDALAFKLVWG